MKRFYFTAIIIFLTVALWLPKTYACFGDKLGIGYIKGVEDEFCAHLVALYIKEKTGIDSIVNKFGSADAVEGSLKKVETDIIIWTVEKEKSSGAGTKFFSLLENGGNKIILEVSKKILDDIRFHTLNKVMERIGKIINHSDFESAISLIKDGKKFSKQAAREYLVEEDLI
jgi:hypothetical protein